MKLLLVSFLRKRRVRLLWSLIATAFVRLLGTNGAAFLTSLGIDWGDIKPNGRTVLCISRYYFDKDIRELRARTGISFAQILGGFTRFQEPWFPTGMKRQTFYQFYDGDGKQAAIRKSRSYAASVIRMASRKRTIDAILSANFDYWQDIGFKEVCKELGIPFLVLSREHPITRAAFEGCVQNYTEQGQFSFEGTAIAVAGLQTYEMIEQSGRVMQDMHDVWITGLPRLDVWRDARTGAGLESRNVVTLISYTTGYSADHDYIPVLKSFCKLSNTVSSVGFVLKCKDYDDYAINCDILKGEVHPNLSIEYDTPLHELLPSSRLVVGYNSLALIDAALSRSPIVIPNWGEHARNEDGLFFKKLSGKYQSSLKYPRSIEEMENCIIDAVECKLGLLTEEAALILAKEYFHIDRDKSSSRQVEEFILHYIESTTRSRNDAP